MDLSVIPSPAWGFLGLLFGSVLGPVFLEIVKNRTTLKASRTTVEAAEITARPLWQQTIQDGFAKLLYENREIIERLEDQIRDLTKRVEEQSAQIVEMSNHISSLEDQIKGLGATPVQRRRAKIDPAVA